MRIPNIIGYSITSITSITPYNHQPGVSNTTQLSETMILRSQHPGEEGPVLIGSHLRKINLPRLQTLMKWTTRMDGKLWSTSDHSSKFSQTNSHQKKIWTASGFRIFFLLCRRSCLLNWWSSTCVWRCWGLSSSRSPSKGNLPAMQSALRVGIGMLMIVNVGRVGMYWYVLVPYPWHFISRSVSSFVGLAQLRNLVVIRVAILGPCHEIHNGWWMLPKFSNVKPLPLLLDNHHF